jgi:hypothetical protein
VAGQPAPGPAAANLTASYAVRTDLLAVRVEVTINNTGAAAGTWTAVVMGLSGLNLIVTPGSGVGHEVRDRKHVFTPAGSGLSPVEGHASVTFSFTVTGAFSGVASCALDGKACVSPVPA